MLSLSKPLIFLWMSVTASLGNSPWAISCNPVNTVREESFIFNISFQDDPLQMHPPLPLLGIPPQELHSQLTMKSHYCKTHSANMPREAFSAGNGFPFLWIKS